MSRFQFYRSSGNIGQVLIGGLILIGLFLGLFWMARGIFNLLSFVAPFLLIAALLVNYRVVTGYGKWLWETLNRDIFMGIVYIALSFFGFPILSAYLLIKAIASNSIKKAMDQGGFQGGQRGYFQPQDTVEPEYEILEEDGLELEDQEVKKYEKLFDSK